MRLPAIGHLVPARRAVFYGWWIVASCFVLQLAGAGLFYYGLGAFFLPLTLEFGWPRALTSSAYSLFRLQDVVVSPLVGYAFDRLGPRKLIAIGVSIAGLAYLLLSRVDSFPVFLVAVLLMALGFNCGIGSIGMAAVANWFVRRRTTALGLVMAGAGAGGFLVAGLAALIEAVGWRATAVLAGATLALLGLPISRVVYRRPEDRGLLPDGDAQPRSPAAGPAAAPTTDVIAAEYDIRRALRTRTFWLLAASSALTMAGQAAVMVHAIPHLVAVGLSQTMAAGVVAAMTGLSVAGRIGFGWLGDRLPKRRVMVGMIALQVAGLIALASIAAPWHVGLFLALYAPGYGGAIPLRPSLQGEYFGRRAFGTILGVISGLTSIGGMLGPVFAGWVFDVSGSYQVALYVLSAVAALAIPAVLALPRPERPVARPAASTVPSR